MVKKQQSKKGFLKLFSVLFVLVIITTFIVSTFNFNNSLLITSNFKEKLELAEGEISLKNKIPEYDPGAETPEGGTQVVTATAISAQKINIKANEGENITAFYIETTNTEPAEEKWVTNTAQLSAINSADGLDLGVNYQLGSTWYTVNPGTNYYIWTKDENGDVKNPVELYTPDFDYIIGESGEEGSASAGIIGSDADILKSYIGKVVDYAGADENSSDALKSVKWQIFDVIGSGENAQFVLIALNCVNPPDTDGDGSDIITSDYGVWSGTSRAALINYINDVSNSSSGIWSSFVNKKAEIAKGSPNLEEFIHSYNISAGKTPTFNIEEKTDMSDYPTVKSYDITGNDSIDGQSFYVLKNVSGYWIGDGSNWIGINESDYGQECVFGIIYNSYLWKYEAYNDIRYSMGYYRNGVRPVVTLNADVVLTPYVVADQAVITNYKTNSTTPIPETVIALCDAEGTVRTVDNKEAKLTTNSEGKVDFAYYFNLKPGIYHYKEIEVPEGYILNDDIYSFTVNNDGTVTYTELNGIIYNDRVKAEHAIITKYIANTVTPLPSAKIALCDENGTVIKDNTENDAILETNNSGQVDFATIKDLYYGEIYYYKETQSPAGYVKDTSIYSFTVDNNGNVVYGSTNGKLYNNPIQAEMTKYKKLVGKTTTTPVPDAKIGLYLTYSDAQNNTNKIKEFITDEYGKIDFGPDTPMEAGTSYYYKEIEAPEGYVINSNIYSFIVNNDGTTTFLEAPNKIMYDDRVVAEHAIITNYRTNTNTPLKGTKIALCDINENILKDKNGEDAILETDDNGQVDFATIYDLEPTIYYYKEIEQPVGYQPNDELYSFIVDNKGNVLYESENGIINNNRIIAGYGKAVITKYRTGTETTLDNAQIGLCDAQGNIIQGKDGNDAVLTTGGDGKVDFATVYDLEPGDYYYKEVSEPKGYIKNDDIFKFTVDNNGNVSFEEKANGGRLDNDRKYVAQGKAVITKYRYNTETPLSEAQIALCNYDGTVILKGKDGNDAIVTTKTNGKADFATVYNLEPGEKYYYTEVKEPAGYLRNAEVFSFTVDNDGEVTFSERAQNGIIYDLRAYVSNGIAIVTVYRTGTTTPVPGARITLCDISSTPLKGQDGNDIVLITNDNGQVDFSTAYNLEPGNEYYYTEILPAGGYIKDNELYKFTVDNNGVLTFEEKAQNGIIYNDRVYAPIGSAVITKYRTDTGAKLPGAEIALCNADGTIKKDRNGQDAILTTGEDGEVDFATIYDLEPGTYFYKELTPPPGYEKNDILYTFTVDNSGHVSFSASAKNGALYNNRVYAKPGSAVITKYRSGTNHVLKGAKIALCDIDGNILIGRGGTEAILETEDNGQIDFATIYDLEPGQYFYKEIEPPVGYEQNNEMYSFEVDNDGIVIFEEKAQNGILYNDRVYAKEVKITKYKEGTTTPIPGVEIAMCDPMGEVQKDSNNNDLKLTTDSSGQVDFTNLGNIEPGTYYYRELAPLAEYNANLTIYEFTVNNDGTVTFGPNQGIIYNSKKKVTQGNAGAKLTKLETGTTNGLQGVEIELYDANKEALKDNENNNIILTTLTDGTVDLSQKGNLEFGEIYYYKEKTTLPGFIKDENYHKIIVDENGNVTIEDGQILYNSKKKVTPGNAGAKLTKLETGTTNGLQGVEIELYDANKVALKDNENNNIVLITLADGTVDLSQKGNFEFGEIYYYKEKTTLPGFIKDENYHKIIVDENGQVTIEDGQTLYNSRLVAEASQGEITKYRTGSTTPVPGAKIGVYNEEGTLITELTTNSQGKIYLGQAGNLQAGKTYKYKETEAPTGYIKDSTEYTFTVGIDGTIPSGIIYNEENRSYVIEIQKTDKSTGLAIRGVQFVVTSIDEQTGVAKASGKSTQTDGQGKALVQISGVKSGETHVYTIKEDTPNGYKDVEEIKIKVTMGENGEVAKVEQIGANSAIKQVGVENGKVVVKIENEKKEDLYLRSNVYTIDNSYLYRVSPKTTVAEFIANCESNGIIEVFDQNGNKLNGTDLVGTGMTIRASKEDQRIEKKIAVIGDLNGDGKLSLIDIARAELSYVGNITLENEYELAVDINNDGKQSLIDTAKMELYYVGMLEL